VSAMKEPFVIRLTDRFSSVFKSFGVDYPLMRKILALKLKMDKRRAPTIMSGGKKGDQNSSFTMSLLMYALMGVFIGIFIFMPYPMFLTMNLTFGLTLFMVMTTMISDFSSVLLDVKEKNILLTRPVDPKTLNAAKLVHIVTYLAEITLAIAGIPLVAGTVRYGPVFLLLFVVELVLLCSFVILFTSILYFLILQFFSGEKLKDIINYFQIALTVFMVVAYQFIGRIYTVVGLNIHVTPQLWNLFLPSAWFAAPFSLFIDGDFNPLYILLAAIGVVVPLLAMFIYTTVAAPAFERNLQKLSSGDSGKKRRVKKGSPQDAAAAFLCKNELERTFFKFTGLMLKNERKLKLKLYPSLAMAFVLPFIFLFSFMQGEKSFSNAIGQLSQQKYYLLLYFSAAILTPLVQMLGVSENYKGAWIYRALPVSDPSVVLKGAVKAFIVKYIVPFYLVWTIALAVFYGPLVIPQAILIFLNNVALILFLFAISKKELPFYKSFDHTQGGKNLGIVLLLFLFCALFAGIQLLVTTFFAVGIVVLLATAVVLDALLFRFCFRIGWRELAADAE
jgi:hypothetical protein